MLIIAMHEEEFPQLLMLQEQQLQHKLEHQKQIYLQLIAKETNSSGAIEKLQSEHRNSQQHIKDLEERLEEIQGQLLTKLKALDGIQEKNASLQEEISSLKNTLGYVKGTETAPCQLPSAPLHTSDSKANISAKPSEKVLYSRFMQSTSTVTLLHGKSSSRTVRFPVSSVLTLNKNLACSSTSILPEKQHRPCSSTSSLGSDAFGQGQDYIRSLFADTQKTTPELAETAGKPHVPPEYYNSSASSAVGNLKIVEIHPRGHYVKILNSSPDKEEGIGDHTLQQNFSGHPIAIFKFPPAIRMKANSLVTIWAAESKKPHKPPTEYLWKDLDKFQPGPECTTILCNSTGQAVAWFTPINWSKKQTKEDQEDGQNYRNLIQPIIGVHQQKDRWEARTFDKWQGTISPNLNETNEPEIILREEKIPPILYPVQNSWCRNPSNPTHPHYSVERYLPMGSEGNRLGSQTRTQPVKHGPDTGILCTGSNCGITPATGDSNRKSRVRPTRSAGPNLGGVIYVGSAAPIGSALQKYSAHSSYNCRLLTQASLTPINFLQHLTEDQ
ncbi:lamin tail domain-containing protein 1 isoform X2 [Rhineura floridana]|uniref:lamin tail domain-containing protein 1 isoform X2 n=1 Tax=Rhineura floridana TaxID=261503 RepID=UPI002AC84DB1|nr:lamin tail domain-containing protein 1 isoform X2 [Rhineura floridana]